MRIIRQLVLGAFLFFSIFSVLGASVQSQEPSVNASAFLHAEFGELLIQYQGQSKPELIRYGSNEEAARALKTFQQRSDILYAQPNYRYEASTIPNDSLLESQLHLDQINAEEGWTHATSAKDVVIAVIDSGVDVNHPDLKNNLWRNPGEVTNGQDSDGNGYVDDIHGWDFLEDIADPTPKLFPSTPEDAIGVQHGTMVAGIIASQGDNGLGIAGVTWQTQLMPLRVLNHIGIGNSETVTLALQYAIDNGADIINMSLVGTDYDPIVVNLLNKAYQQGIIVVAAAGNNGSNLNAIETFPVCYNQLGPATVIGVGAIDKDFKRPSFSNYGSDCVDIVAPGVNVFSTRYVGSNFIDKQEYKALFSGTSFAAPQVTGLIALMKQLKPSLNSEQALFFLQAGSISLSDIHASGAGFNHALNVEGTLDLFVQTVANEPEEPIVLPDTPDPTVNPEFLAYPLGEFGDLAFKYQLPGPLLLTPVVFEEEILAKGMRMTSHTPFTVLINAWRGGSKKIYRYNLITQEMETLFELPVESEQTAGEIAVGNVDFDDQDDLVIVGGPSSKPLVGIYNFDGSLKFSFQPYGDEITGGLSVALWDINNDGINEIAVVPANQTDGHIKVFEFTGLQIKEWIAYERFGGGATLSTGDINNDGVEELLVGPGATGGPHVKMFNVNGEMVQEFFAGDVIDAGGADVELYDFDRDGIRDFVFTFKQAGTPVIRLYDLLGNFKAEYGVLDGNYREGVGIVLLD